MGKITIFKGKRFSIRDEMNKIGFSDAVWVAYKKQPEKFEYMCTLGATPSECVYNYMQEQEKAINRLLEIHYEMIDHYGKVYQFSKHLHKKGYFNNPSGFSNFFSVVRTNRSRTMPYEKLKRLQAMAKEYEKWKTDQ